MVGVPAVGVRSVFRGPSPTRCGKRIGSLPKRIGGWLPIIDDYSRFIPASRIFDNATTENAPTLLEEAIDACGTPEQILTDPDVQFYSRQDVKTEFTKFLERKHIQHIVTSKRRPTTTGKVERFHRSYEEEAWHYPSHLKYINHYNYERPHQALNLLKPTTRLVSRLNKAVSIIIHTGFLQNGL